ncbi:MAG: hypothetical protein ABIJ81_03845 [Patescibacteria group bacterium]
MKKNKVKKIILVLVGEKLSGKEMVSRYLVKHYGFVSFRFSKILVDILKIINLPVTRVNEINLISGLRERFGAAILAEVIVEKIRRGIKRRVVIDGLRHPAEYDVLSKLPGFKLVYITAGLQTRFARAKARGEKVGETHFTLQQFKREEKMPTEIYIKRLGKRAQVKIINEGSLNNLYSEIKKKLSKNI